jgi:hypothetical protein
MATMALLLKGTDMVIVKVMSAEAADGSVLMVEGGGIDDDDDDDVLIRDSSQSRMLPSDPPTAHVLQ